MSAARSVVVECSECGEDFALNSAMLRTLAVLRRDFPDIVPAGYLCEPCSNAADDSQDWVNVGWPVEVADA